MNNAANCALGRNGEVFPPGYVFRARLILSLTDGLTYRQIGQTLGASAPTVSKWKMRLRSMASKACRGAVREASRGGQDPGLAGPNAADLNIIVTARCRCTPR